MKTLFASIAWMLLYLALLLLNFLNKIPPEYVPHVFLLYAAITSYLIFFKDQLILSIFPMFLCAAGLLSLLLGYSGPIGYPFIPSAIIVFVCAMRGWRFLSYDTNAPIEPQPRNIIRFDDIKAIQLNQKVFNINPRYVRKIEASNQTYVDMANDCSSFSNILYLSSERHIHKKRAMEYMQGKHKSEAQESFATSSLWAIYDSNALIQNLDEYKKKIENEQKFLNDLYNKLK